MEKIEKLEVFPGRRRALKRDPSNLYLPGEIVLTSGGTEKRYSFPFSEPDFFRFDLSGNGSREQQGVLVLDPSCSTLNILGAICHDKDSKEFNGDPIAKHIAARGEGEIQRYKKICFDILKNIGDCVRRDRRNITHWGYQADEFEMIALQQLDKNMPEGLTALIQDTDLSFNYDRFPISVGEWKIGINSEHMGLSIYHASPRLIIRGRELYDADVILNSIPEVKK